LIPLKAADAAIEKAGSVTLPHDCVPPENPDPSS
jgi:hypothetical protein